MALQSHMTKLEDLRRACWARTSPVAGQPNAWEFRRDVLGNLIRFEDFGKRHSPFGWEIEYVVARSMGGSTDPENLQALHWKASAARMDVIPRGRLFPDALENLDELGIPEVAVPA